MTLALTSFIGISHAQEDPIIGIFNLENAAKHKELGSKAARIFAVYPRYEPNIERNSNGEFNSTWVNDIKELHDSGVSVILTMRYLRHKDYDESPLSSEENRIKALTSFENLIEIIGPYIDYVTLENEPVGEIIEYQGIGKPFENRLINWFAELAAKTKELGRKFEGLRHIKVGSPSFSNVEVVAIHNKFVAHYRYGYLAMMNWIREDDNVDFVDIHLHVADVPYGRQILNYLREHTDKPFIATEWSQAKILKDWLEKNIDESFSDRFSIERNISNQEFVEACYESPISKEAWDAFIETSPLSESFITDFYKLLREFGVEVATYGQIEQYGHSMYDLKSLYGTKTIKKKEGEGTWGEGQENSFFKSAFVELTKSIGQE